MNKFLNNSNYPEMTPQLCVDRLFQTADYDGLRAGVSDSNDILKKDYSIGSWITLGNEDIAEIFVIIEV